VTVPMWAICALQVRRPYARWRPKWSIPVILRAADEYWPAGRRQIRWPHGRLAAIGRHGTVPRRQNEYFPNAQRAVGLGSRFELEFQRTLNHEDQVNLVRGEPVLVMGSASLLTQTISMPWPGNTVPASPSGVGRACPCKIVKTCGPGPARIIDRHGIAGAGDDAPGRPVGPLRETHLPLGHPTPAGRLAWPPARPALGCACGAVIGAPPRSPAGQRDAPACPVAISGQLPAQAESPAAIAAVLGAGRRARSHATR
jgi:hypothetical protein